MDNFRDSHGIGDAAVWKRKADLLAETRRIYYLHPAGLSDKMLAAYLGVSRATACRYRIAVGAVCLERGIYTLEPTADDIEFAKAIQQRTYLDRSFQQGD